MVEGQRLRMEAVAARLAAESVAQEHVEPREGRPLRRRHVFLQRNDARQPELAARRMDAAVVFREYRNAVEEDRLHRVLPGPQRQRSEEHTSELQSLMRISYAVFCLKKKINTPNESQQ